MFDVFDTLTGIIQVASGVISTLQVKFKGIHFYLLAVIIQIINQ